MWFNNSFKNNLLKLAGIVLTITTQLIFSGVLGSAEVQPEELPKTKLRRQTRTSGGTRGQCLEENNTITLVVPEENQDSRALVHKTTLPRPTVVWHLSQKSDVPVKITVVEQSKTIYLEELILPFKGFVVFTLPETAPPLEKGKQYRWTVSLLCSSQYPSRNPYTQSWIERVDSSLSLKQEPNAGCDTYERAEIWYDTLACYLGTDYKAKILALLQQVNLEYLSEGEQVSYQNNLINSSSWPGLIKNH